MFGLRRWRLVAASSDNGFSLFSCLTFTRVIPPLVRMDSTPHLHRTKGKHLTAR